MSNSNIGLNAANQVFAALGTATTTTDANGNTYNNVTGGPLLINSNQSYFGAPNGTNGIGSQGTGSYSFTELALSGHSDGPLGTGLTGHMGATTTQFIGTNLTGVVSAPETFSLGLNTDTPQWTLEVSANGVQIGATGTYVTNPTIDAFAIGS
jgi:hypothetical protein